MVIDWRIPKGFLKRPVNGRLKTSLIQRRFQIPRSRCTYGRLSVQPFITGLQGAHPSQRSLHAVSALPSRIASAPSNDAHQGDKPCT